MYIHQIVATAYLFFCLGCSLSNSRKFDSTASISKGLFKSKGAKCSGYNFEEGLRLTKKDHSGTTIALEGLDYTGKVRITRIVVHGSDFKDRATKQGGVLVGTCSSGDDGLPGAVGRGIGAWMNSKNRTYHIVEVYESEP